MLFHPLGYHKGQRCMFGGSGGAICSCAFATAELAGSAARCIPYALPSLPELSEPSLSQVWEAAGCILAGGVADSWCVLCQTAFPSALISCLGSVHDARQLCSGIWASLLRSSGCCCCNGQVFRSKTLASCHIMRRIISLATAKLPRGTYTACCC